MSVSELQYTGDNRFFVLKELQSNDYTSILKMSIYRINIVKKIRMELGF